MNCMASLQQCCVQGHQEVGPFLIKFTLHMATYIVLSREPFTIPVNGPGCIIVWDNCV